MTEETVFSVQEKALTVSYADENDRELLWEWRNDPETRRTAFETGEIHFEQHCEWFNSKINSETTKIFIIKDSKQTPVGQIRFDIDENKNTEIDVFIAKSERGKGYATASLKSACVYGFTTLGIEKFTAHIKTENAASIALFTKAGFTNNGELTFKNTPAIKFVLEKTINE
jgi:RimJ/RimL family protein N-acetyltransferase